MNNSERRAAMWEAFSQILHYRLTVMFSILAIVSLLFGAMEATKFVLETHASSIDFYALIWYGFTSAWKLFWHAGLVLIVVVLVVAAIVFSTMATILSKAQSAVQNEGYLGFDEPHTPSTPSGELRKDKQ